MEIIVISVSQYKEKDAVVNAITDSRSFSFYGKGLLSPKNKNSFLNCILTKANISLIEGKIKYPILEQAEPISSPFISNYNFEQMNSLMLIDEAVLRLMDESEQFLAYDAISHSLEDLKNGVSPILIALHFLLKLLPLIGFEIEVNKCLACGSKKGIVDFSFIEGGFLCGKCSTGDRRYSNAQLLLIRNNILSETAVTVEGISNDDIKFILNDLRDFIDDGVGYRLKQLEFLLK